MADKKAPRGKRTDSVSERVKATQDHGETPVPAGVRINTREAKILWKQFTDTRTDWLDTHLITLGKIVHLEIRIRKESNKMAEEDVVITTRLGEVKENPRLQAIDRLVKQQATLIRMIGLNVNNDESAKLNRRPKSAASGRESGEPSASDRLRGKLLAMPGGKAG